MFFELNKKCLSLQLNYSIFLFSLCHFPPSHPQQPMSLNLVQTKSFIATLSALAPHSPALSLTQTTAICSLLLLCPTFSPISKTTLKHSQPYKILFSPSSPGQRISILFYKCQSRCGGSEDKAKASAKSRRKEECL